MLTIHFRPMVRAILVKKNWFYSVEVAQQTSESGGQEYDATYLSLAAGMKFDTLAVKLGYESLDSDDGQYGFATPLATLHKFNGCSDQFLNTPKQGLDGIHVSLTGKLFGGTWVLNYPQFRGERINAGCR
ncbi:hypothetical protein [Marinifaba aquimaris]|uniref:hypothetical protein n=1 Tax=Marinifaba aquimaris TaxID=2741323 RepID=UPI001FE36F00|nr:hypothetical protein [Marinifaba aquimaris]